MFKKVLIANRGEIALRILRALRKMGIKSVVVHAEEDRQTLAVQMADQAVCIGDFRSYLAMDQILSAALITGAEAIHPGYGFLSENPVFFQKAQEKGLVVVGPSPDTMKIMGDKAQARKKAVEAGLPVIQGSDGPLASEEEAVKLAENIGYPILLKAVSGGGGRGMRVVKNPSELLFAYRAAKGEAKAAFGDDRLYLETYLENPKHLEIQILGFPGGVYTFVERDCSLQRRHQKVIEESPGPRTSKECSLRLQEAAKALALSIGYQGAGTIEFLVDQEERFYFIEMNTRIQVEHPVTEMLTDTDLVEAQLRVAAGEDFKEPQKAQGHVIECRINAEDPSENFRPSPGKVRLLHLPSGPDVRWESHLYDGYTVPPYFDALIGKVIVQGNTREEALRKMTQALGELLIENIATNKGYLEDLLKREEVIKGDYHTRSLEVS